MALWRAPFSSALRPCKGKWRAKKTLPLATDSFLSPSALKFQQLILKEKLDCKRWELSRFTPNVCSLMVNKVGRSFPNVRFKNLQSNLLQTDYFVWFFRAEYGIKLQYTYIYLEPLIWGIISAASLTRTVLKSLFAFRLSVAFIFQIYLNLRYAKGVPIQVKVPLLYDLRRILFKAFPFLALQCFKFLLLGSCLLRSL